MTDRLKIIYSIYHNDKTYYSGDFRRILWTSNNVRISAVYKESWELMVDGHSWLHFLRPTKMCPDGQKTTKY